MRGVINLRHLHKPKVEGRREIPPAEPVAAKPKVTAKGQLVKRIVQAVRTPHGSRRPRNKGRG